MVSGISIRKDVGSWQYIRLTMATGLLAFLFRIQEVQV
jgi:hypothetical protein